MTRIKICGITNLPDASAAVEAGADMLGFNFWPGSPRYVKPAMARQIIEELPPEILMVGVFVNAEHPADVRRIADEAGVSALQLTATRRRSTVKRWPGATSLKRLLWERVLSLKACETTRSQQSCLMRSTGRSAAAPAR